MDNPIVQVAFADVLLESLLPDFPAAEVALTDDFIQLTTCSQES